MQPNGMIERVAKAIYLWECDIDHFPVTWGLLPEEKKKAHRQQAEAAIKALLNPTMEMVQAGDRFRDAGEVWRVMALTALEDERATTMTESADFYEQHTP